MLTTHQATKHLLVCLHSLVDVCDLDRMSPLIPSRMIESYTMYKNISQLNHCDMLIGPTLKYK